MSTVTLLALADQRLPGGGHVHSGGVEQAVTQGLLHDLPSLARFLQLRLAGAGLVAAGLAAAAAQVLPRPEAVALLAALDAEADARMPSPAQRAASRAQGRGLLRVAAGCWPGPTAAVQWSQLPARAHHPVVLGCAAAAGGADGEQAALAAAYLAVTGPATAAQRLLALDPVGVAAVTVQLGAQVSEVARRAASAARAATSFADLPDDGDCLLDLLAEGHAHREERLFAS